MSKYFFCYVDMVGDDVFDFTGPGLADILNEKNLVLVYRFSLEIEKARSMFGRNHSRANDLGQMSDDEGEQDDNIGKLNQNVNQPVLSEHQGNNFGSW